MEQPQVILLMSGKRKSGKDYICGKVKALLGETCTVIQISGPLKGLYAAEHSLNLDELMSDGPYKEKYRRDMIEWSDELRRLTPGYFCKAACDQAKLKPVWIVSDVRRNTDILWFKETYSEKIKTVRISADIEMRMSRDWQFTKGVDDVTSECDLDGYTDWDLQVSNNNNEECENAVKLIINVIKHCMQPYTLVSSWVAQNGNQCCL